MTDRPKNLVEMRVRPPLRAPPSAFISICASLMRCIKANRGFPGRARSERRAGAARASHCPLSRVVTNEGTDTGQREGRGIQLMMSLWRKLNQRPSLSLPPLLLPLSLYPLFGFASHPNRRSFCGAPQGGQETGESGSLKLKSPGRKED